MKPLAIDLFCGLGGWTDGLLAEGYDVTGYDIEEHTYGAARYQGKLVIQDVKTLHGAQFKDVALIVASPPCQEYSYMAMPWKLAKAKAAAIRADTTGEKLAALNCLFDQCFRIQREASFAAGRIIPMIVENVRGAVPWVGRARWNYGSFYLWGDVPALMPPRAKAVKVSGISWSNFGKEGYVGKAFNGTAKERLNNEGVKGVPHRTNGHWTNAAEHHSDDEGRKIGGDWFSDPKSTCRRHGSKSKGCKMASAMIAKIPMPLSRHIAATFHPMKQKAA